MVGSWDRRDVVTDMAVGNPQFFARVTANRADFRTTGLFAEATVPFDARQCLVAGACGDPVSTTSGGWAAA